jgi:hypothetical protein
VDINTNTVGNGSSSFILNQCSNSVNQQFTLDLMINAITDNKNMIINTINNNIATINNYLTGYSNSTNTVNNNYTNYNNQINNELNNQTPYNNMENAFNDMNKNIINYYNYTEGTSNYGGLVIGQPSNLYNIIIQKINNYNNKIYEYNNYVSNIEKLRRKSNYLLKYIPLFTNDINTIKSLLNQQYNMINSINSESFININNDYMKNKINYSNKLVTDALNMHTKFDISSTIQMNDNISFIDMKKNISAFTLNDFGIVPFLRFANSYIFAPDTYNSSRASQKSNIQIDWAYN